MSFGSSADAGHSPIGNTNNNTMIPTISETTPPDMELTQRSELGTDDTPQHPLFPGPNLTDTPATNAAPRGGSQQSVFETPRPMMQDQVKQMANAVQRLELECTGLKHSLEAVCVENERLVDLSAKAQQAAADARTLNLENSLLKALFDVEHQKRWFGRSESKAVKDDRAQLKDFCEQLQAEYVDYRNSHATDNQETMALMASLKGAHGAFRDHLRATGQVEEVWKVQLNTELEAVRNELRHKDEQMGHAQDAAARAQEQLAAAHAELEQVNGQLDMLRTVSAADKERIRGLELSEAKLTATHAAVLAEYKTKGKGGDERIRALEAELQTERTRATKAEQRLAMDTASLSGEITVLREQLRETEQELEKVNDDLTEARAELERAMNGEEEEEEEEEAAHRQTAAEALNEKLHALEEEKRTWDAERRKLEASEQKARTRGEATEKLLMQTTKERGQLQKENTELMSQVAAAKANVERRDAEIEELRQDLKTLKLRLDAALASVAAEAAKSASSLVVVSEDSPPSRSAPQVPRSSTTAAAAAAAAAELAARDARISQLETELAEAREQAAAAAASKPGHDSDDPTAAAATTTKRPKPKGKRLKAKAAAPSSTTESFVGGEGENAAAHVGPGDDFVVNMLKDEASALLARLESLRGGVAAVAAELDDQHRATAVGTKSCRAEDFDGSDDTQVLAYLITAAKLIRDDVQRGSTLAAGDATPASAKGAAAARANRQSLAAARATRSTIDNNDAGVQCDLGGTAASSPAASYDSKLAAATPTTSRPSTPKPQLSVRAIGRNDTGVQCELLSASTATASSSNQRPSTPATASAPAASTSITPSMPNGGDGVYSPKSPAMSPIHGQDDHDEVEAERDSWKRQCLAVKAKLAEYQAVTDRLNISYPFASSYEGPAKARLKTIVSVR
jgi:predicted  nucleic acid-binding Zn-ribbon protein